MPGASVVVDLLKRELRSRAITYARVARELRISEASVKRMFSRKQMTLQRLDEICRVAQTDFSDLARALLRDETEVSQLTYEQEKEIVSNPKLFLVAVCVLNHVTFEQIIAIYDVSRAECVRLLARLDRLKFISLQPNNRIRLLVSRNFSWLPDGPIQRFFNQQAHNEYFRHRFDRPEEFMIVVNGMLSKRSAGAIIARLRRIAREFSDLHQDDLKLPIEERSAMSMLVAIRQWELQAFASLRRGNVRSPAGPATKE
jgi:DNA-binding Xre family transcriptional regulator